MIVNASTGNVVQKIQYDEFGNVTYTQNENEFFDFTFAGGMYDNDTKLIRFGARDYDPNTGRWTAKDPIGFGGGQSNLYEYCVNDPVNYVDPEGLQVTVYYETIGGGGSKRMLAQAVGARHAYTRVQTDKADLMLERIGDGSLTIQDFDPNRGGLKSDVNRPSECPDGDYSFENKILDEFNRLKNNPSELPKYYNDPEIYFFAYDFAGIPIMNFAIGGAYNNSNTFANYLIQQAGGSIINIPATAFGSNSKFK